MSKNISVFVPGERPGPNQIFLSLENSRVIEGWQSICQLFMLLVLTKRGSVPTDPAYGSDFVPQLWGGAIQTNAQLKISFDQAVMAGLRYLLTKGYNERRPDESKLSRVVLRKWALDSGHAELWVDFYDGSDTKITTLWVPVSRPDEGLI